MAQRLDCSQTVIVSKPEELCRLFFNPDISVNNVRRYGEKVVVNYSKVEDALEPLPTSALHIAALTTGHARIRLFRLMAKVEAGGGHVVYTDTDSLVYLTPRGKDVLFEDHGPHLGMLTSELDGEMLEFVTCGPKVNICISF